MNYVSWSDLHRDIINLMEQLHHKNLVGVVGVPRSGMIPAAQLATMMGLPLASLPEFNMHRNFETTHHAGRVAGREREAGPVLLLEDAVNSGQSLLMASKMLCGRETISPFPFAGYMVIPATLYIAKYGTSPSVYVREVAHERIFAWNWLDSWLTGRSMFDMDGVLCADPETLTRHRAAYRNEIINLYPRYIPKRKIHTICTNRMESFRRETEHWLTRHHVRYGKLLMLPDERVAANRDTGPQGIWKIEQYAQSDCKLFVESSIEQSGRIFKATGRPVLCTDEDVMMSS